MRFSLASAQRRWLIVAALVGILGPNGLFVYAILCHPGALLAALRNPAAMAFVAEAFLVLVILAVWIARTGSGRWGWKTFVVLSLIGGLGFSIPLFIVLSARDGDDAAP